MSYISSSQAPQVFSTPHDLIRYTLDLLDKKFYLPLLEIPEAVQAIKAYSLALQATKTSFSNIELARAFAINLAEEIAQIKVDEELYGPSSEECVKRIMNLYSKYIKAVIDHYLASSAT